MARALLWLVLTASTCVADPPAPLRAAPAQTCAQCVADPEKKVSVKTLGMPFVRPRSPICAMTLSPNGRFLVIGGGRHDRDDKTRSVGVVFVLDPQTGTLLSEYTSHTAMVHALGVSRDGLTVFSGDDDGWLRRWRLPDGDPVAAVQCDSGVRCIAADPGGRLVAISTMAGSVTLYDESLHPISTAPNKRQSEVLCLAFSSDGGRLITGDASGGVCCWNMAAPRQAASTAHQGAAVWSVTFLDGNGAFATGGGDGKVRVWSADLQLEETLDRGHTSSVVALAYTDGPRLLASAGREGDVCLWDISKKRLTGQVRAHTRAVSAIAWTTDGGTLFSAGMDSAIRAWEVTSGRAVLRPAWYGHSDAVCTLEFSTDGSVLASGSNDESVLIWDVGTGMAQAAWSSYDCAVNKVQLHCNDTAVWSYVDGAVYRWRIGEPAGEWFHAGFGRGRASLSVTPSMTGIVVGGWDGGIRLYGKDGTADLLAQHGKSVTAVAVSPDGKQIATGATDGTVRVMRLPERTAATLFEAHEGSVVSIRYTADGSCLLTAGLDRTMGLWDVGTGKILRQIDGFAPYVENTVTLSADDRYVATMTDGGGFAVWELVTGTQLYLKRGLRATTYAWDSAHDRLAFGSAAGHIVVEEGNLSNENWTALASVLDRDVAVTIRRLSCELGQADAHEAFHAVLGFAWLSRRRGVSYDLVADFIVKDIFESCAVDSDIRKWLDGLRDERFTCREQMTQNLRNAGTVAISRLRDALTEAQSEEEQVRIRSVLDSIEGISLTLPRECLRRIRGIQVLEIIRAKSALERIMSSKSYHCEVERRAMIGAIVRCGR